jgi:hypothetical protein
MTFTADQHKRNITKDSERMIKDWFARKERIYSIVIDLEDNVVRETEKAVLVKVFGFNTKTYNEGNVEKWIPKSVLMTKEEVEAAIAAKA